MPVITVTHVSGLKCYLCSRFVPLLARVLSSKYVEHTPLYRQSEIYDRQGVELSRSLLPGWVDACCRLLSPLEEVLQGYVLTDGKLHADDPPSRCCCRAIISVG